jgi:hypothetical protein
MLTSLPFLTRRQQGALLGSKKAASQMFKVEKDLKIALKYVAPRICQPD